VGSGFLLRDCERIALVPELKKAVIFEYHHSLAAGDPHGFDFAFFANSWLLALEIKPLK
jgi:hypothetical protein